jgi:hypothetical protein
MALWCNGLNEMDKLSLKFSEQSALRQIDSCTDINELKKLTRSLMRSHFGARSMICDLLLRTSFTAVSPDDAPPSPPA